MGFLRRILGGREPEPASPAATDAAPAHGAPSDGAPSDGAPTDETPPDGARSDAGGTTPDEVERARERELLRADAARLEDELLQRQLRYADRSWTPPRQGGERRSEDGDAGGRE